jgi:Transglutaminase-like superfamily
MAIARGWCFGLALVLSQVPAAAQPPAAAGVPAAPGAVAATKGTVIQDAWDVAYLDGKRAGYVHLVVKEIPLPSGQKFIRASRELKLAVRRFDDVARVQVTAGTDELPAGQVLGTFMVQSLGEQVTQKVVGTVEGKQLRLHAEGQQGNFDKYLRWDGRVVGTYGELNLLKKRTPPPKKGETFEYRIFEPIINAIVTVRGQVEDVEAITFGGQQHRLLRVTAVPDLIADIPMPGQVLWFDKNYEVARSATRMPGMGNLVIERGTQEAATAPIPAHLLPSISDGQSIFLSQRIPNAHAAEAITFRVTLPQDRDPAKTFAADARQQAGNVKGKSFDLVVRAVRTPPDKAPADDRGPGAEFLESNFFITSDDPRVKQHAAAAVGTETDPWQKALRVERWVNRNMKVLKFSEAMAPAAHVAETLAGDCTEYSMLAAAMCRAAGVPARTAIGLVYVDGQRPFLGFHMWTEVYVRGAWAAIDATLGQGGVGPAHLKICDHSWHDMRAMTPLLPIMRVMLGEPTAEVVEVKGK